MDNDNDTGKQPVTADLEGYRRLMQWMGNIIQAETQEQKEVLICQTFRELCGAEEASLFLYDGNAHHYSFRASSSEKGQQYRRGLLEGDEKDFQPASAGKLEARRSLITVHTEENTYAFNDTFTLIVPISVHSKVCALVFCEYGGTHTIDASGPLELIQNFLVQLSALFEYYLDKTRLETLAHSLELLYEIGTKLSSIRDEDKLLEAILDLIEKNIKVDRCSLMIVDDERKYLQIKKAFGIDDVDIEKVKVPIGQGIAGYVATGTRPLLIKDLASEKHLISQVPQKEKFRTKSLLSVPLVSQGDIIGVINVNNRKDGLPFSEADMSLLSKIGSEIAAVLQRSYMALQLKKAKDLDKDIKRSMI